LPSWTSPNRSIEKTDLVLWYTVGMHHLVRAEDWSVIPILWHTFELRPVDFFNGNPAMDLPRKPQAKYGLLFYCAKLDAAIQCFPKPVAPPGRVADIVIPPIGYGRKVES
jgi:hypothetical protein